VAAQELLKAQESVKLNVSGKFREVHRMTAERIPLIAAMLRFPRDGDTPLFIDANPKAFDVVLELARGRSRMYMDSLEPSLKALVCEYAEYCGLPAVVVLGFEFLLIATHPTNKAVINTFSFMSQADTVYTTGVRPQWNTVFGSVQIPQTGLSYWEVEVSKLGTTNKDFLVGVVTSTFIQVGGALDASGLGWALGFISDAVQLRQGGQAVATLSDAFPITEGTRIGILVDSERGSLMFFHNGEFKLAHTASMKGHALFPALSVCADTVLKIKTGLVPPL